MNGLPKCALPKKLACLCDMLCFGAYYKFEFPSPSPLVVKKTRKGCQ